MRRFLCVLIISTGLLGNLLARVSYAQTQSIFQTASSPKNTSSHETVNCKDNGSYVNSQGQRVKRPEDCSSPPSGATAQCRDGTYSFSTNHRGTCSHHGGVAKWF
jgi:hypothetical protein